jgi:molybdopterin converting factor small subunit
MNITVKLYAHFRECLPKGVSAEGIPMLIDETATVNQVLQRLAIPIERAHLVLINGVFIAPINRDEAIFKANDVLAVWPQVAGG